jgi:hypothetical protein
MSLAPLMLGTIGLAFLVMVPLGVGICEVLVVCAVRRP